LIHGLSGDQAGWEWVMPVLSKHYRTIAPDVRGHGDSGKPDMPYTIQQFSADIFALFQELEISQAHLLGFSMGAAIAQSIHRSQWKILEGAGHNIYIEKPAVLAQAVLEFLGRQ